jgi:hypothetical protein
MAEGPFAMATSRLVADLIRDTRRLVAAEIDLARAELSESRDNMSSGLAALAGGAAFLLAGLIVFLAGASDLAFLAVAGTAILIGWLLLRTGMGALQPRKLLPARSLSQISSLFRRG